MAPQVRPVRERLVVDFNHIVGTVRRKTIALRGVEGYMMRESIWRHVVARYHFKQPVFRKFHGSKIDSRNVGRRSKTDGYRRCHTASSPAASGPAQKRIRSIPPDR